MQRNRSVAMFLSENRREERKDLVLRAQFRSINRRVSVEISDISEHGCRIDHAFRNLELGDYVILRTPGFESFFGTIRWIQGRQAGIEFDYSLHPAIVDHLCRKNPVEAEAGILGRPD